MFRSFCLKIVRLLALGLFLLQLTFNGNIAFAQVNQPPEKSPEAVEKVSPDSKAVSAEDEQKTDAKPVRESAQRATRGRQKVTYPQAPHPYDRKAIDEFNEELYGE